MMTLVYSALRPITATYDLQLPTNAGNEYLERHFAYKAVCEKYQAEIESIQKFLPGWLPDPPSK